MRFLVSILAVFAIFSPVFGQISPPGLDDTRAVAWGALGVTQQTGSRWQSTVYLGASRESNPDNYSFLRKPAISVIDVNQLYKFNSHWSLAGAISYRKQTRYSDDPPYNLNSPGLRDELRYYLRLYYRHKIKLVSMTYSFRPEYRTYYYHAHSWDPIPQELRFRFKVQAAFPLNQSGSSQFILGNEWLTATDHRVHSGEIPHWTHYAYTEDRATTYFRHTFSKPSLIVDAGFMYQFINGKSFITHFAFDLIVVDPFKNLLKK